MADFRIKNLSLRIEDQALPEGTIIGQGKLVGDVSVLGDGDGGDSGCGCSCTCSCTCTCTSTSSAAELREFDNQELERLRSSLRGALEQIERVQQLRAEQGGGATPDVG